MSTSHWQKYHARWSQVHPPLRPNEDVVTTVQSLVGVTKGAVLLLGVTPELADAFPSVHAIDRNSAMIEKVWPGDTPSKRAHLGDWLDLDGPAGWFSGAVGDGSLSALESLDQIRSVLARVNNVLAPGSAFACRLYERPAVAFNDVDMAISVSGGTGFGFHAFKWQIAMQIAERSGASVPVVAILEHFNEKFPDRDELVAQTGWSRDVIDTIDVYANSPVTYTFPNRKEILDVLPLGIAETRFVECGTYDLAACCPILTFRKS